MIMIIIVNNSESDKNPYPLDFLAHAMHYSNFE